MSDITIPKEAWASATKAIKHLRPNPLISNDEVARAACLAMLRSWPGIKEHKIQVPDNSDEVRYTLKPIGIILPLIQEKPSYK